MISVFRHQGPSMSNNWEKILNIIIPVHNLQGQWFANLWQIVKSLRVQHFSHWFLYLVTRGQRHVYKLEEIIISSFLFIIYIHNELQSCSKSWNVSGYIISVILISVFGHQGASICLKIGKNLNIIIPVHNLHAQWIENLWQIMKSIRVQHFSHIDFCIWPPGGSDMSKNWKKS